MSVSYPCTHTQTYPCTHMHIYTHNPPKTQLFDYLVFTSGCVVSPSIEELDSDKWKMETQLYCIINEDRCWYLFSYIKAVSNDLGQFKCVVEEKHIWRDSNSVYFHTCMQWKVLFLANKAVVPFAWSCPGRWNQTVLWVSDRLQPSLLINAGWSLSCFFKHQKPRTKE